MRLKGVDVCMTCYYNVILLGCAMNSLNHVLDDDVWWVDIRNAYLTLTGGISGKTNYPQSMRIACVYHEPAKSGQFVTDL